eukprot:TRINITY_DN20059_c0_g2_i2.p1 TRINITY_DN20059_c0_g2~~TRINITY_DN20059_c0_g2_i2.p1  ORF type:complete len:311 (+),score=35.51 TRINITY_DN20059_c0_g2_i2:79-933(+)
MNGNDKTSKQPNNYSDFDEQVFEYEHGRLGKRAQEVEAQILKLLKDEDYSSTQSEHPYNHSLFQNNFERQEEAYYEQGDILKKPLSNNQDQQGIFGFGDNFEIANNLPDADDLQVINSVLEQKAAALQRREYKLEKDIQKIQQRTASNESQEIVAVDNEFQLDQDHNKEILQDSDEDDYSTKFQQLGQQERLNILIQALCEAYKSCRQERENLRNQVTQQNDIIYDLEQENKILGEEISIVHQQFEQIVTTSSTIDQDTTLWNVLFGKEYRNMVAAIIIYAYQF